MQAQVTARVEPASHAVVTDLGATSTLEERVQDFLAQRRIAVTGISAKRELSGD